MFRSSVSRAATLAAWLALPLLPGTASAADWTGIWTADTAWCKYKDQIGAHDPAPFRYTAAEFTGLENSCKVKGAEKIGELPAWMVTLSCSGEGTTYDTERLLMLADDGALWEFEGYEPFRFTRCDG